MTEPSALAVRGVALYLPVVSLIALALYRRPSRRTVAAAVVATAWHLPALLAVNAVAVRAGWWSFAPSNVAVAGVPVELWLGWALLWGAVPVLVTTDRPVVTAAVLVAADVALMPLCAPVLVLGDTWLAGEAVAVAVALVPALLLARWTARGTHPHRRAALQVVAFGGLLLYVVPSVAFTAAGDWSALLARPRWHFVVAGLVVAPFAALALQAIAEFAAHGGTPVPLDPPATLVTTGPYAYVANPMQLGSTVVLAAWAVLLRSPAVLVAAATIVAFAAGVARLSEERDLGGRFGAEWAEYRGRVRRWVPLPCPVVSRPAVVYAARSCAPCREVGDFLAARRSSGLTVAPAEQAARPLRRVTYEQDGRTATGVAAIGRALEHVHLGWAVASWVARLPGVRELLQLVVDGIGGEPRTLPPPAGTARGGRRPGAPPAVDPRP